MLQVSRQISSKIKIVYFIIKVLKNKLLAIFSQTLHHNHLLGNVGIGLTEFWVESPCFCVILITAVYFYTGTGLLIGFFFSMGFGCFYLHLAVM